MTDGIWKWTQDRIRKKIKMLGFWDQDP
jgi:hypothetical protein